MILLRNSAPILSAPVPLSAWTPMARPAATASLESPSSMAVAAAAKDSRPRTGRYSWLISSRSVLSASSFSAVFTHGRIQGLPSSVL